MVWSLCKPQDNPDEINVSQPLCGRPVLSWPCERRVCGDTELVTNGEGGDLAKAMRLALADDEVTPEVSSGQKDRGLSNEEVQTPRAEEFMVSVDKAERSGLGLDVDMTDGATLLVNGIEDGLIMMWNQRCRDQQVRKGDRFLEVNGIKGDARQLIEALNLSQSLKIRVRRPDLFDVTVRREGTEDKLGMELSYCPGGATLLVQAVSNGLVQQWNQANPGRKVERHDRILEVNSFSGKSQELYMRLSLPGELNLTFMKAMVTEEAPRAQRV
mmetsp:Transcript_116919/g.202989  ORF Transcript_116919/g.202989 Transcript_116919/m.202989 type:complete len:271 (-) Transcript_116919:45-857(-)